MDVVKRKTLEATQHDDRSAPQPWDQAARGSSSRVSFSSYPDTNSMISGGQWGP